MNDLLILGETLDVAGKIMIAFAALRVSYRFRHEHKVDAKVFKEMKLEQDVAVIGIVMLIVGYLLRVSTLI
jgi:hypothetical protein